MSQIAIWFVQKDDGIESADEQINQLENLLAKNINKEVNFSYFCICQQSIWDEDYKCNCIYPLNRAIEYMIDNCPELLKMLIPESKYGLVIALANSSSWNFLSYQVNILKIWLKTKTTKRKIKEDWLDLAIEA